MQFTHRHLCTMHMWVRLHKSRGLFWILKKTEKNVGNQCNIWQNKRNWKTFVDQTKNASVIQWDNTWVWVCVFMRMNCANDGNALVSSVCHEYGSHTNENIQLNVIAIDDLPNARARRALIQSVKITKCYSTFHRNATPIVRNHPSTARHTIYCSIR